MVLTALAGVSLFVALNVVVGFIAFAASYQGSSADTVPIAVAAVAAVLFAFGGGTALIMLRKPWSKGLGMGLMIGWALVTVCTVGFCTGVNPTLYSSLGVQ
ncbi:hypothetical protein [Nocardia sp. XZ_19_385]|uniref:hypothetical protein n=1 Tax=Nocardia sp. XZ_19_385 TaxID=2769488 RepID=UPI0028159DD4|nr:hypothetical protein [Nocardia sp. XZ_19_385]